MDIEKTLESIGFTKTEIKVYLHLLKSGKCKADKIVKGTNLYKSNVYLALNSLMKKGFIGEITINKVKHFEAYGLEKVFDVLDERKREIDKQKENIRDIIENTKKESKERNFGKVNFYVEKGIKTVFYDILNNLKKGDTLYAMGSRGDLMLEYFEYYFPNFVKQRIEKGIKFKGIFATDDREEYREKIPKLTEAKFLKKEGFTPMQTMIYKNKVAIFIVEDELQVILIENTNLAKGYKNYFDHIWNSITSTPFRKR